MKRKGQNNILTVANEGDPIPKEERKKIFLRFYCVGWEAWKKQKKTIYEIACHAILKVSDTTEEENGQPGKKGL